MQIKKTIPSLFVVAVLPAVLLLGGCGRSEQGGFPPQGPAQVGVVTIQPQQTVISRELPGRISALTVSDVRPQVGGIIQKRLFTEGGEVKAGQVLYQIDPETYKAAFQTAQATLDKTQASLASAELKAKRYAELVGIKAVSTQDNDDAQAALLQAKADVSAAKAALETARINLSYTSVTAPVSGRIGKSSVTPGALVTANQANALATIQQLDHVYVDLTQSSADMLRLRREFASGTLQGTKGKAQVRLVLEDGSEYASTGELQFADVTVDAGTGMVSLRATFENPKNILLPGMFVRARLEQGVRTDAILVPQAAVTRNQRGDAVVMVVGDDNNAHARIIKASQMMGDKWLVDSGLKAGEKVIVEGLLKVQDGKPVKPEPFQASAAKHNGV